MASAASADPQTPAPSSLPSGAPDPGGGSAAEDSHDQAAGEATTTTPFPGAGALHAPGLPRHGEGGAARISTSETPDAPAADGAPAAKARPSKRRWLPPLLGLAVLAGGSAWLVAHWGLVETDNAQQIGRAHV